MKLKAYLVCIFLLAVLVGQTSASQLRKLPEMPSFSFSTLLSFANDVITTYQRLRSKKYKHVSLVSEPGARSHSRQQVEETDPKAEKSYISDIIIALWEFVLQPNEQSFWKIVAVARSYDVIPYIGGWARAEAYA